MPARVSGSRTLRVFLVLLIALCTSSCRGAAHQAPPAEAGTLDLRSWDFTGGNVELRGEWSFVPGQLLEPAHFDPTQAVAEQVPSGWNEIELDGAPIGAQAVGTYALTLLLPPEAPELSIRVHRVATAHRIWINGEERPGGGAVAADPEAIEARMPNRLHALPRDASQVRILVQVANMEHREGGLRKPWLLGSSQAIQTEHGAWLLYDAMVFTLMLAVGCHFLLLYGVRRKQLSHLMFALLVLGLGVRTTIAGNALLLLVLLPQLPFEALARIEYTSSWLSIAFGVEMIHQLYSEQSRAWAKWPITGCALLMAVVTLLTPPSLFMRALSLFQLTALLGIGVALVTIIRALIAGREGALALLVAFGVFTLAVIHDVMMIRGLVHTPFELASTAFAALIAVQASLLVRSFARSFTVIERLSDELYATNQDLAATNTAVERFVPFEFLEMLEHRSIRDVARGDYTNLTMEVMFCDIRSFTTIAEGIDSQRTFDFINEYLHHMEPPVHGNEGFIDSYQGDGILALFYGGADKAVSAAIGMLHGLDDFNAVQNYLPGYTIRVGIGLNSGELMLGTIGGLDRLDNSVVGDPVNLASRIEGMTKMYGTPLLISGSLYRRLAQPESFMIRELDRVVAKGKTESMLIYEVLDGLPQVLGERRWALRETFAEGVAAYRSGDFPAAWTAFDACLADCPEDQPARVYLERCQVLIAEPPVDWRGLTVLTNK